MLCRRRMFATILLAIVTPTTVARAEVVELRLARQWGLAWMPFVLMEKDILIEKHVAAAGLGGVKLDWRTFAGGSVMNDALLAGGLDYATTGIPGFLTLWDKAKKALPVKAVSAFGAVPFALLTRNPAVKTIKDFSDTDRIAVPTTKISGQAVLLQMAAEKAFGVGQHGRLDAITISRSNPDGMAAMLSGISELNSQFSSPPYQNIALRTPGVHVVLTSKDIFSTPFSNGLFYTTQKFHDANPKVNKAVVDALAEAIGMISADRRRAVADYLAITKEPMTAEQALEIMADPFVEFSLVPHNVQAVAEFMYRTGALRSRPLDWKELFFPEAHRLDGN